ncbi:MAG: hypothetical protein ACRBK7_00795 [Acidimicrobiales bacterium]
MSYLLKGANSCVGDRAAMYEGVGSSVSLDRRALSLGGQLVDGHGVVTSAHHHTNPVHLALGGDGVIVAAGVELE